MLSDGIGQSSLRRSATRAQLDGERRSGLGGGIGDSAQRETSATERQAHLRRSRRIGLQGSAGKWSAKSFLVSTQSRNVPFLRFGIRSFLRRKSLLPSCGVLVERRASVGSRWSTRGWERPVDGHSGERVVHGLSTRPEGRARGRYHQRPGAAGAGALSWPRDEGGPSRASPATSRCPGAGARHCPVTFVYDEPEGETAGAMRATDREQGWRELRPGTRVLRPRGGRYHLPRRESGDCDRAYITSREHERLVEWKGTGDRRVNGIVKNIVEGTLADEVG